MRTKLIIILVLIGVFVGVCWAIDRVQNYPLPVQQRWVVVDTTSVAGAEPNDLAVDERTYTAVVAAIAAAAGGDDEISIYFIPDSFSAGRFRCVGWTDGGNPVYEIYFGTLGILGTDCELVKAGQLDLTVGTQASTTTGYELADAVTVTEYCWPSAWGSASPSSNLVAEASVNFAGADIMVVVPSATDCNCMLLMKGVN